MKKRFFSIFTALALLFSTLPVNALAVGNSGVGGLCEHHPSHTAECGYTEGAEGTPCNHEHTEDCYTLVEKCIHEHTDECYPEESVSGNTATPGNAEEQEPTECAHECSEESGCIVKELDCQHEHDDECGYAPATEGTPCGFVCEVCGAESTEPEESTKPEEAKCICETLCAEDAVNTDCPVCGAEDADLTLCKGEPAQAQYITITGFDELPEEVQAQIIPAKTKLADLNLPDTLGASGYVGTQDSGSAESLTIEGVEWESDPAYDENAEGSWLFTAKLPENYTLLDGVKLPQIGVMAEPVNLLVDTPVKYINYYWDDGAQKLVREDKETEAPYTPITQDNATTDWQAGWYVVRGEVSISERITVTGKVHLILADGCKLKAEKGITVIDDNSLTIYAQSEGADMGILTANSAPGAMGGSIGGLAMYQSSGEIIINGGNITATGGMVGIGGSMYGHNGTTIINGGIVTANGSDRGIGAAHGGYFGNTTAINGGVVTTNGIGDNYGSSAGSGLTVNGGLIRTSKSINDATKNNGLIILSSNGTGTVYGNFIPSINSIINTGEKITIPDGAAITVPSDVTFKNSGTITNNGTISGDGDLQNNGTIANNNTISNGTVDNSGEITNNGTISSNGDIHNSGTVINSGSISCNGTIQNDGTISNSGEISSTNPIENENGIIHNSGTISDVSGGTVLDRSNAEIINNGSITINDQTCSGGCKGHYIVGTGAATTNTITVESGTHDITIENINIAYDPHTYFVDAAAFDIKPGVAVNLTLEGDNYLKSDPSHAGLHVPGDDQGNNATLVITEKSTGSLTVTKEYNYSAAGIGGNRSESGGNITINGGDITVKGSGNSAGIGGGYQQSGGNITITDGNVVVELSTIGGHYWGLGGGGNILITGGTVSAKGIGDESGKANITITGGTVTTISSYSNKPAIGGTFSTTGKGGNPGNAVIIAGHSDQKYIITDPNWPDKGTWSGLIITGNTKFQSGIGDVFDTGTGKLYGDTVTPTEDFTIPAGATVTIENGKTLVIDKDITMTVDGKIINEGTIKNYGEIVNWENIQNNPAQYTSEVKVTFQKDGSTITKAAYGDTIKIVAAMARQSKVNRTAAQDTVDFYLGTVDSGIKLNQAGIAVSNNQAALEITLTGTDWTIGDHTITADFGGSSGLMESSGQGTLKVICTHTKSDTKTDDCTASVECSICKQTISPAQTEHSFKTWTSNNDETHTGKDCANTTCTGGACTQTKTEGCSGGTATCIQKAICGKCNAEYGVLAAHDMAYHAATAADCTSAGNVEYWSCDVCGKNFADKDGKTELQEVTIPELKHDWGAWKANNNGTHSHTCKRNSSHTETKSCSFGAGDTCTICGGNKPVVTYTVTFDSQGGSPVGSQTITSGGKAAEPAAPKKDGYTFAGWYNGGTKWDFSKDTVTGDLTLTAHWTADTPTPADKYEVKVEKDGNGTAYATPTSAQKDETITLTAKADSGYHFERWEVVSGGVTISGGSFKMPANDVIVKAIFEKNDDPTPPATKYTVTVNGSYSAASGEGSYEANKTVTIDAGSRRNYRFNGWTSSDGITFADAGSSRTTFTMPGKDVTVTATWKYTGGDSGSNSGGGNSGSGSGGATIITRPDEKHPDIPTTSETKPVKPDKDGNVSIGGDSIQDAINKAATDANKNGNKDKGIAVTVPVNNAADAGSLTITIPAGTLDQLVAAKVRRFDITTNGLPCFSFTLDTLEMLDKQSLGGDLILRLTKTTVTSKQAKEAIDTRPAYDIALVFIKDGKKTPFTDWQGKTVSVKLPYTPAKDEQAGNLYAVYVDAKGKVEWLTKSSYNADQKAVIFEAGHFSVYGVGYKNPAPVFTDITGHWAADNIIFAASRGLLAGTGNNQFSPNTGMTRGMFVTALGRLAGIDPESYKTGKFTDVKADAYYAPYVNWAAEKGIVSGTSATTFSPDTNITREQMAVIMAGYAKKMGYDLPVAHEAVTFADNAQISSWAAKEVKAMQQAGIMAGKGGNRFDPKGTATRAEVATVLRRFVEIVIDPQAAQGWVQDHSGSWQYMKDGKAVTGWLYDDKKWYWLDNNGWMFASGWKQIDGKWYYFYSDGSMAVNTTIDGYTVGPDGARK